MARKTLNRRELREESDAAAKIKVEGGAVVSSEVAKKPAKAPPAKRKSRAKVAKEVRLKAFWGVFAQ